MTPIPPGTCSKVSPRQLTALSAHVIIRKQLPDIVDITLGYIEDGRWKLLDNPMWVYNSPAELRIITDSGCGADWVRSQFCIEPEVTHE